MVGIYNSGKQSTSNKLHSEERELESGGNACEIHETKWTEVVRKPKKGKPPNTQKAYSASKKRRVRNPAILVSVGEDSYAGILKKIKLGDSVKEMAEYINSLSKTKNSNLLVQLKGGTQSSLRIAQAIGDSISDPLRVNEIAQYDKIVIQDLDELADEADVIDAISETFAIETTNLRITANFMVQRGMRWMVVSMTPGIIEKVLQSPRMRVRACLLQD